MDTNFQDIGAQESALERLTTSQRLCLLAWHDDEMIRARAAENPQLPVHLLALLSQDDSVEVRISVADNPRAPIAILELLARDPNPDVRFAIAENAKILPDILGFLTLDDHPYVADRARKTLERLQARAEVRLMLQCA